MDLCGIIFVAFIVGFGSGFGFTFIIGRRRKSKERSNSKKCLDHLMVPARYHAREAGLTIEIRPLVGTRKRG